MIRYKGIMKVSISAKRNVIYVIEVDKQVLDDKIVSVERFGYMFREVKKYSPPPVRGHTYGYMFQPTYSNKFGKTHVLKAVKVDNGEWEEKDMFDQNYLDRRILVHGGSKEEHSAGCWIAYLDNRFKAKRLLEEDEMVTFELEVV